MGFVVLGVLEEDFVHVGGGVLVEFVAAAEDDEGDLAVAQHRQLVGLLHHPEFALVERHLITWLTTEWVHQIGPLAQLTVARQLNQPLISPVILPVTSSPG